MRRSILLSLVVIGAAVAVVFGGSTFALFNDTATGTGTVSAGTVNVIMEAEADDVVDLNVQSKDAPNCPEPLGHTESCEFDFTLQNIGNLSASWAVTVTPTETPGSGTPGACFTYTLSPLAATLVGELEGGDLTLDHDAGEPAHNVTLTVTASNDAEGCQGATTSVVVQVVATQSATPHD